MPCVRVASAMEILPHGGVLRHRLSARQDLRRQVSVVCAGAAKKKLSSSEESQRYGREGLYVDGHWALHWPCMCLGTAKFVSDAVPPETGTTFEIISCPGHTAVSDYPHLDGDVWSSNTKAHVAHRHHDVASVTSPKIGEGEVRKGPNHREAQSWKILGVQRSQVHSSVPARIRPDHVGTDSSSSYGRVH